MVRMLTDICIYILAVFGAISLIACILNSIRQRARDENGNVRLVLVVKNQQDTIEGIIRNVFSGDFLSRVMSNRKLLVLDLGSKDETLNILQRLKKNYEYIEVLEEKEKEKVFQCIDNGW